ncbi:hypothetical protein KW791_02830 [Candidatus Parcubacteria bacterium]|nr:hypothetical protein [Candidatus Parcubacteria bacterium]
MKTFTLRIAAKDKEIFEAIKTGKKKVETRAASARNGLMKEGDSIVFVLGSQKITKKIKKAKVYKTIGAMLRVYKVKDIAPHLKTPSQLRDMYQQFSGYAGKIKKFGIIAVELK